MCLCNNFQSKIQYIVTGKKTKWELFEIRNRGEYHGLHVQTDTLFLVDVLEKIIDTCIDIYRLDPSRFLSAPGLAWQEPV